MEVTGQVKRITTTRAVSDRFKFAEVHIETAEQYPQVIAVQFANDKLSLIDDLQEGETITIHVNLRGREVASENGVRVWNTLTGWKVDRHQQGQQEPSTKTGGNLNEAEKAFEKANQEYEDKKAAKVKAALEEEDDLPY